MILGMIHSSKQQHYLLTTTAIRVDHSALLIMIV